MKQAENIFIHYLKEEVSGILFGFRGKAKIIWVIWGADLYTYLPLKLYDNHTLELLIKLESRKKSILKRFSYYLSYELRKKIIKRIDYIISPFKGDVRLLKKYFKTKAEGYSKFIYPNPVDFEKIDGKKISLNKKLIFKKKGEKLFLLGNSGFPTNNHLDIMIRLFKLKKQNFKIICPLSYGPKNYIKKIVEKGEKLFGNRFVPLLDFYNPDQYFGILKQIDLAIMYHNRQQGMGTIILLIYMGKPICMKKTPGYFYLIQRGVHVFSTQELEMLILNEIKLIPTMSEHNKTIVLNDTSVKSTISSIRSLFEFLHK
ncbi:MAG: TDP-N-acetylfucosamine:lipid II N-acetylfucosaminyltransferase [Candidatus Lokiarchaeota archaeon]|nr:TDP-N-acetylfucosamine:lipid II N-acetylfucosaminyltransferase [Candidatus Lokiarchaeota archaeon]